MMSGVTSEAGGDIISAAEAEAAAAAQPHSSSSLLFRNCPIAAQATSLLDGVPLVPRTRLDNGKNDTVHDVTVIMPWIAFGTYKLGAAATARRTVRDALSVGYRHIDTALIYGKETTEIQVGLAIQDAIQQNIITSRRDVFITTKHWRAYHGYEATLKCLNLSLQRLKVDYIDLWLMHWPGPAFHTKSHRKDHEDEGDDDPWNNAIVHDNTTTNTNDDEAEQSTSTTTNTSSSPSEQMVQLRAETWRAMEYAYLQGKVRAIGVSNFSIQHLQTLEKTTAAIMIRPMVNQVELHPLHPQNELKKYCQERGIIVQAYASLGGQDADKKVWKQLLGGNNNGDHRAAAAVSSSSSTATTNKDNSNDGSSSNAAGKRKRSSSSGGGGKCDLLHAPAVVSLADQCHRRRQQERESSSSSSGGKRDATTSSANNNNSNSSPSSSSAANIITPAQLLLRWALEQNVAIIPKSKSIERMRENIQVLDFHLTPDQVQSLSMDLLKIVRANHHHHNAAAPVAAADAPTVEAEQDEGDNDNKTDDDNERNIQKLTRLCWIKDPFRHLEFD